MVKAAMSEAVIRYGCSLLRLLFARAPGGEGLQHIRVGKKSVTLCAKKRAINGAGHVAASGHFLRGDLDLATVTVGIGDGGAVDDTIQTGPESIGHAHRARLAGGIHSVAGQGECFESFCGLANGAKFGVGAGVAFGSDCVACPHQYFSGVAVDDKRAEGDGRGGIKALRREADETFHEPAVYFLLQVIEWDFDCHVERYHGEIVPTKDYRPRITG